MRLTVLFLFLPLMVSSQKQRVIASFTSSLQKLYVTPGEQLIISTRAGELMMADSLNALWQSRFNRPADPISSATFENSNFFNKDTGFVSGYIHNGTRNDIIYRTTDGGRNWEKVNFGKDGWADGAFSLRTGEAWMSISGQGFVYSSDYGKTWQNFSGPTEIGNQRFSELFFNARKEGLIGGLWNYIAYTPDNCLHWRSLPTPLAQHKYNKTDKAARPEINDVAIYKDYFLVSQENLIFYTKRDSINWMPLAGYTAFSTDIDNSALYLRNEGGYIVRVNDRFEPVFKYEQQFMGAPFYCANGSLFLKSATDIYKLGVDNSIRKAVMYTEQEIEAPENQRPGFFGTDENRNAYGNIGSAIYRTPVNNMYEFTGWKHLCTLPIEIADNNRLSYSANHHSIRYIRNADSTYLYDIRKKQGYLVANDDMLKQFSKGTIASLSFSRGSQGCDHSYVNTLKYDRSGDYYTLTDNKSTGSEHSETLNTAVEAIDKTAITEFLQRVCSRYRKQAVIKDLAFTDKDYRRCKKDIEAFRDLKGGTRYFGDKGFYFNKNNLDFEKLLETVDSIKTMDSVSLNEVLRTLSPALSTTTNWIGIMLTDDNGNTVSVNNVYYDPNAMGFPWRIVINGATVFSTSPEITAFIRKYSPGLIAEDDRVPIMYELVKKLYK